jgi:signal transduction histidine kinase
VSGEKRPLPPALELSAYRIVQEALTNTLRHARAEHATVTLRYDADRLDVEVVDDGTAHAAPASGGHGLIGMRERAASFGGRVDAGPRGEGGFRVAASLPVTS